MCESFERVVTTCTAMPAKMYLDCLVQEQQQQQQQQQQQDVLTAQQVAMKRGSGSSGDGNAAVPATIPRLMQQPT